MYRTLGFHRTVAKLSKISVNSSSNSDLVFTSTRTLSISSSKFSDIRLKDSTTSLTSNGISEDTFTTILGEPTFYSQGLGWPQNIYPSGVVQSLLETIHLTTDFPWWGTIVTSTVIIRVCMIPLMVYARRAMVNQINHQPAFNKIKERMQDPNTDIYEKRQIAREIRDHHNKTQTHPWRLFLPIMANGGVLCCNFFALRQMAAVPVASMKTGGILWFQDLTLADPYFLLPVITATSVFVNMKLGGDGTTKFDDQPEVLQKVFYGLILVSIPIASQFPTALNVYWLTSNLFTIFQAKLIQTEYATKLFKIGKIDPFAQAENKKQQQDAFSIFKMPTSTPTPPPISPGSSGPPRSRYSKVGKWTQQHEDELQRKIKEKQDKLKSRSSKES